MQVSEADDEGESDTKAPPWPSRDKQALPTADAEEKPASASEPRIRFWEPRLEEEAVADRAWRCLGLR